MGRLRQERLFVRSGIMGTCCTCSRDTDSIMKSAKDQDTKSPLIIDESYEAKLLYPIDIPRRCCPRKRTKRALPIYDYGCWQLKSGIVSEVWFRDTMKKAAHTMSTENITQIICAFHGLDFEFVYESEYDINGIVYWVAKHDGEKQWVSPAKRGSIRVVSTGYSQYT